MKWEIEGIKIGTVAKKEEEVEAIRNILVYGVTLGMATEFSMVAEIYINIYTRNKLFALSFSCYHRRTF